MASDQSDDVAAQSDAQCSVPSIHKLDQVVVNRIAAGEVVHRPASALKEMMENSLDAGATSISVLVKAGGLKLLQIQDNGHGIRKDDLGIVCERFTTSKLRAFEDLENISTYGFRGEALASITHVAHVAITTMTEGAPCAYRACYQDGKLIGARPGLPPKPKPCAGVRGTIITVEDMFFNIPTRRKALRSASEEYQRVLDVVTRYAIHYGARGVGFTCKKHGSTTTDVHTHAKASVLDNVGALFGRSLQRELLPVAHSVGYDSETKTDSRADGPGSMAVKFKLSGFVSNANYSMKKSVFILFINHRLVDCPVLKRAVEAVFSDYLPKRTHPFVYLAIEMPGPHVDVNVHPTKREVHFLHEDELVSAAQEVVQKALEGANSSRSYYTQVLLPNTPAPARSSSGLKIKSSHRNAQANRVSLRGSGGSVFAAAASRGPALKHAPNKTVRTDATSGSLDTFVVYQGAPPAGAGVGAGAGAGASASTGTSATRLSDGSPDQEQPPRDGGADRTPVKFRSRKRPRPGDGVGALNGSLDGATTRTPVIRYQPRRKRTVRPVLLTSVRELLADIDNARHDGLQTVIRNHVYVGTSDDEFTAIQHETKLLLVNHSALARDLFYQLSLRFFANLESFTLDPAPLIEELALLGIAEYGFEGDEKQEAKDIASMLSEKSEMLEEYFGIQFVASAAGVRLTKLPMLLDNYTPLIGGLPEFIVQLAWKVNWNDEKPCFRGVARALGNFFALLPLVPPPPAFDVHDDAARKEAIRQSEVHRRDPASIHFITKNILFPAMREFLVVPRHLADNNEFIQLACTEQLYKIFERC